MNNFHGIFIGINHYQDSRNFSSLEFAEKDARDVRSVFTDPKIGFPSIGSVEVLCGEKATKHNIEGTLHSILIKNSKPEDTIVVYYSGHGFLTGEEGMAFLGAYDTQMADIAFNPNSGLRMDYIYNSLFQQSKAGRILFILDCCYSEAFIPPAKSVEKTGSIKDLIDNATFPQAEGRIAIFSSPRKVQSRENYEKENGVFTYHLVEGLKGGASEVSGDVTVESLLSYVKLRVPDSQPAGFAGKMIDRFVLTRNHSIQKLMTEKSVDDYWKRISRDATSGDSVGVQVLASPLANCFPFIDKLTTQAGSSQIAIQENIGSALLEVVRRIFHAQMVGVIKLIDNKPVVTHSSRPGVKDISAESLKDFIGAQVSGSVGENMIPLGVMGISKNIHVSDLEGGKGVSEKIMMVPLVSGQSTEFMVVYGIPEDGLSYIGESFAVVLKSLYAATKSLNVLVSYSDLKGRVFDDIKAIYHYVPLELYEERFRLFAQNLSKIYAAFEPILYIDPAFLDIVGWETLARDPLDEHHAPAALFSAAELWGPRFMIELDKHMVRTAVTSYRKVLDKQGTRPSQIRPLSVNVYPASLIRRAYREAVFEIIEKEKMIPGDKLILEISEKLPIVTDLPLNEPDTLQEFKRHLSQYTVSKSRINFAIDDFGVGYSSVSRLASISPFYVKVDRDVLLRKDFCEITLRYVKQMVELHKTSSPVIVIEGFDGSTDMAVTLKQIYNLGITHVQGYIVGKAGPVLYELDEHVVANFRSMLTE